jgi:exodeoxyribonuclease VII large subunit
VTGPPERVTEPVAAGPHVYTVAELLGGLRHLLEERVGRVWVVGEIRNLRRPASGHAYFTLAGDGAHLRAALFRSAARRLPFEPEEGMEVLVYGELTLYEARGDLQILVRQLEPRGRGALQLAVEQLRRRLEAEGWFDPARKRPLPVMPGCVGVVTSATGAALRDVIEVSGRRLPSARLLLAPSRVQGQGAELEIAEALDRIGSWDGVDLVLLVRGGGSLEDLQPFNTEVVVHAIARCGVPVVTGVGHEIDLTLADLAADARAPTPSAAAERALPDRAALSERLERDWRRLRNAGALVLERLRQRFERERDALQALAPSARLAAQRARLRAASRALERAARGRHDRAGARLAALAGRLESLSPLAVLSRGYALVRRSRDGEIVRRADQLTAGERISIRVAEAELDAAVEAVRPSGNG